MAIVLGENETRAVERLSAVKKEMDAIKSAPDATVAFVVLGAMGLASPTLEKLGIRIVIYPQEMLAASVRAMRGALASLKGGERPPMATPAELGTAIRLPEYLAADARLAGGGG